MFSYLSTFNNAASKIIIEYVNPLASKAACITNVEKVLLIQGVALGTIMGIGGLIGVYKGKSLLSKSMALSIAVFGTAILYSRYLFLNGYECNV